MCAAACVPVLHTHTVSLYEKYDEHDEDDADDDHDDGGGFSLAESFV